MSPLWRAAAAAAARRRPLGRLPSAEAASMTHGRRTMSAAASSSAAGTSSIKRALRTGARGMVSVALGFGGAMLLYHGIDAIKLPMNKLPISREAHEEEMKGILKEIKKVHASNDEILALLKADRATGECVMDRCVVQDQP